MAPVTRRVSVFLCSASIVLATAGSAAAGVIDDPTRALRAAAHLAKAQQPNGSFPAFSPIGSTADAVLALVAAGVGPNRVDDAVAFLRRNTTQGNVNTTGLRAKVVLAIESAGRDATNFGGHDLLGEITETELPSGRYAGATVFDQALAVLAGTAHTGSPDPQAALWLYSAQCPDGGWEYAKPWKDGRDTDHCRSIDNPAQDFFRSDTNTTSYALMALDPLSPKFAANPFAYLDMMRDEGFGGWGYTFGFRTTDANSTALVLQAYTAFGVAIPAGSLEALRALQYRRCGAFAYTWSAGRRTPPDLGATIGAVPGLLLMPFPYEQPVAGAPPSVPGCH
jgi:hypothetical protein